MHDAMTIAIGQRLRAVRTQRGLSLHAVETKSHSRLPASVVGSWERGTRNVPILKLYELADIYGVPVTDLLPHSHVKTDPLADLAMEVAALIERRAQTIARQRGHRG